MKVVDTSYSWSSWLIQWLMFIWLKLNNKYAIVTLALDTTDKDKTFRLLNTLPYYKITPPPELGNKYVLENVPLRNWKCYQITSANNRDILSKNQKYLIYLHGSGFSMHIMDMQWKYLCKLVDDLQCRVFVPIYPKIPYGTYKECYPVLVDFYRKLIQEENISPEQIVLFGDSAGGNICLGLSIAIKQAKLPQPFSQVIVNPPIDCSINNQQLQQIQKKDHLLTPKAIEILMTLWADGKQNLENPLVNPLKDDLLGLAKITMITGGRDISTEHCEQLYIKLQGKCIYFRYENMIHNFLLQGTPEAQHAHSLVLQTFKEY